MKFVIVIPARLRSTRLPNKMMADINGKTLIGHVFERACATPKVDRVLVATDSQEIYTVVKNLGGEVYLTSPDHPSGTDRIAEVVEHGIKADVVVNLQGDLIMKNSKMIDDVLKPFYSSPDTTVMSTLKKPIDNTEELHNPNVVKVVTDAQGRALYFSRALIPYVRDLKSDPKNYSDVYYKHYGLYAYQRDFLLRFVKLPMGKLEKSEKLEQLRALEHGYSINVIETRSSGWEIDTQEDLERARAALGPNRIDKKQGVV